MLNTKFTTETHEEWLAEAIEQERPEYTWRRIAPIDYSLDASTTSVAALVVNHTGKFQRSTGAVGEAKPLVGYTQRKVSLPMHAFDASYTIAKSELRAFDKNNNSNPIKLKLDSSVIAFNNTAQGNVMNGYDEFVGITNLPFEDDATQTGVGDWSVKGTTAEDIVDDIFKGANAISSRTQGIRRPNRVLLPVNAFNSLVAKRFVQNPNITAFDSVSETMARIAGANGGSIEFIAVPTLETDAILYSFDPKVLLMYIPQELTYDDPIRVSGGYSVDCEYIASPLEIRNAFAFQKITGIAS